MYHSVLKKLASVIRNNDLIVFKDVVKQKLTFYKILENCYVSVNANRVARIGLTMR